MDNLKGLSHYVGERLKRLPPGKIVNGSCVGDLKREIDEFAHEHVISYLLKFKKLRIAVRTEFSHGWFLLKEGRIVKIEPQDITRADIAVIVDEVEGTKNFQNKDRFTTFFSFTPKNAVFKNVLEAEIYRWNGESYYFKKDEGVFINGKEIQEINNLDIIDQLVKIQGCFIASYLWMWEIIGKTIINEFEIMEKDMPTFVGNGTTTDSLLSVIFDNSIAIDPRALYNGKRIPYVHDIIPAASMIVHLGGKIVDFDGKSIQIDFLTKESSIPFCAVPPGKVGERIIKILPKIKKDMFTLLT